MSEERGIYRAKQGTAEIVHGVGLVLKTVPDSVTMLWKEKETIPAWQIEDWENELRSLMGRVNFLKQKLGLPR